MPDDILERFITDAVDRRRPAHQPPFETLETRWRRRRTTRRTVVSAVAAVVVAAAIAVPTLLPGSSGRPLPAGSPDGLIPADATAVKACHLAECRTVKDPRQVGLLVGDLNGSEPIPGTWEPADSRAMVVTLTFTGPRASYPVVDVMVASDWWAIRDAPQRYTGHDNVRTSALQAFKLGVVVHDCGVTTAFFTPTETVAAPETVSAPEFVGLTLPEAQALANERNLALRVFGQDGKCANDPTTADRNTNRVNLYLEHGKVTSASRF
jgi:hypothetical protein